MRTFSTNLYIYIVGIILSIVIGWSTSLLKVNDFSFLLFLAILIIMAILLFSFYYSSANSVNFDVFHPFNFIILSYMYLYIFPFFYNISFDYNFGLGSHILSSDEVLRGFFLILTSLILFILGYVFCGLTRIKSKGLNLNLNEKKLNLSVVLLTCIGIISYSYIIIKLGGFGTILNNYYQIKQLLSGMNYFVWGVELFLIGSVLLLLKKNPNIYFVFIHFTFGLVIISTLGGRGKVIYFLLLFLVVYHYKFKQIKFIKAFFLLVSLVIMVGYFYVFRILSAQQSSVMGIRDFFDIWLGGSEFKMIDMFMLVVRDVGDVYPFHYGKDFLNIFTSFIPRSLWINKPVSIDEHLVGFYIPLREAGIPPTLPGTLYYNFGIFGILIGMFIFGLLTRYIYMKIQGGNLSPLIYGVFIVVLWDYLRVGDATHTAMFSMRIIIPLFITLYFCNRRIIKN